ncbi:helix-turn-helix transcriptional regulator [Rhizobium sp. YIM 134829]|uniref:helix-turn-helix transcriptional regulator n=1 Tax=Rhizobium sp. YIM 134829 TaxID=3390453 RepID=UPI00397C7F1A
MKLLSPEGLKERGITLSRSQLSRLMKAGKFPPTIQIGFRKRAWLESEVESWLRQRIEERDQGGAA